MTDTTVDGYWLNSEGVRQEKSQEDIDRENREAAKKASKPNPGKTVAAAKVAASEAKIRMRQSAQPAEATFLS